MKAVVFHGIGDIRLETVRDPKLKQPTDGLIRIAMEKNLTIKAGNTPHRKYLPHLVDLVASGVIDPTQVLTQAEPLADAIEAYKAFDRRESGWVKVELKPEGEERKAA
ncbi:MAG TPA: hypothetical protein VE325_12020 [Burkholderiales bacterium]|nr:hypothetical protein [Burkholderiales bacterium]